MISQEKVVDDERMRDYGSSLQQSFSKHNTKVYKTHSPALRTNTKLVSANGLKLTDRPAPR